MAMLTAWLCLLGLSRAIFFQVEQPASSKLFELKYMAFVRTVCEAAGIPFYQSFLWLALKLVVMFCSGWF